jgi:heptosyltransferase-3
VSGAASAAPRAQPLPPLGDALPLQGCTRALVVKLRHHGDVLLATPVLNVLKGRAPSLEIDALVYHDTAPMLEGHPALSQIHTVGRAWRTLAMFRRLLHETALFRQLRARRYDLIVNLTEHPRGAWLARTLRPRYSVAPKMPSRGAFWRKSFTHLYPIVPRRHQVEVDLDALRRIGVQPALDERRLGFVPGPDAEARVATLVPEKNFILMQPGSRWRFKCWTAEKNAELIDRLAGEFHVVVTSAPSAEEVEFNRQIFARMRARATNLAGLPIKELGALTARARLFIGVDSMPMHLAAAMGTPTVALFGPTGENEWRPWSVPARVVTSRHTCRPCGQDGCGGGKISECLTSLPVDQVHAAVRELLAETPAR